MVSKWKAVKEAAKGEWKELKDAFSQPSLGTRYKKSIQKQQRMESRLAQRTGNKYMVDKKTIKRPKGGWKTDN